MRISSLMCAIMFLGLLLSTLFSQIIAAARIYYGAMLAICAPITVLSHTTLKKKPGLILPLWYTLLYAFGGYAVLINTLIRPDLSAVTLCVFLVAGPLLIIDRPSRVVGFQLALTAVYMVFAKMTKSPYLLLADSVNIACCILLGSVIYMRLNRVKMREARNTQILEKERDMDKLTGLLNKSAMEKMITDLLAKDQRQGALVVMDIDDFKHINDTYGHAFGDIVLQHTADCIRKTVPPESLCGRFGGDEYVLLLPDVSREELTRLLDTLLQLRTDIVFPNPADIFSISLGAVIYPQPGKGYLELFQHADAALYEAKAAGKNCWRID